MKEQNIRLKTGSSGLTERVQMVQDDSGRRLRCILTDMIIPQSSTARIYARKPDGTEVYNNCDIDGNIVSVYITNQVLAVAGTVHCQIEVTNDDKQVTTFEFLIEVKKSLISDSAVESSNEFGALEDALNRVAPAVSAADEAVGEASAAAASANTAAGSANKAAGAANTAAGSANKAAEAANTATDAAKKLTDNIQQKLDAGEFKGDAATIKIGKVTTGTPETLAEVRNTGTKNDAIFDFVIPKGEKGDVGSIENLGKQTITFTESKTDDNIASNESLETLFGKLLKFENSTLGAFAALISDEVIAAAKAAGIIDDESGGG